MTSPTPEQRAQQIWREEAANTPCVGGVWNPNASIQRAMVRMWAEAAEAAARLIEEAIADGYDVPARKVDQCEHGKFGWEGCIACYDEFLIGRVAAIRALSSSAQGD